MPMGFRGVDPEKSAYVELTNFRALSDDEAADIIAYWAGQFESNACSAPDLMSEMLKVLCMSQRYGRPFPLSVADFEKAMAVTFGEDLHRKPVPANLWTEGQS